MDKIAKIDQAVASLCKGDDKRSDAMMMMSPDSNWDQFLTPAPCAIALLGELILISADTDFSLDEKPPRDGFKLLRYPNSFRASLVQVSNAGWRAFNEAHTSMNQVRLDSGNVDAHVKTAVKFLIQGTPDEVKRMLPKSLSKIQNIADESLVLAKAIEDQFIGVMELTGELLEASTNSKGVYDEKTKETKIAIEVARIERKSREKEIKDTEKRLSNMEKEVQEAQSNFKEAMNSIPTGGTLLCMAVCEALIDGVRSITSFAGNIRDGAKKKSATCTYDEKSGTDDACLDNELSRQRVYSQVSVITKHIYQLTEITTNRTDDNGQQCRLDMKRIVQGDLCRIQQFIENSRNHVNSEENSGELRERVLKLCNDAVEICSTLQPLAKSMTDSKDAIILETVNKTKYLQNEAQKLEVEAHKALGRNPLDNKSPHLSKLPPQNGSSSVVEVATENARYKTEVAKEVLRDAKRRQEKSVDELRESNEKMTKVLMDMAKLDLKKIDFDTIRETLIKGIKSLAEVREQWGKLVRFFQMLSNLIKCCLHSSLTDFVDQATVGREIQMANNAAPLSDIFRDVIFEQALKASQVAYVVHTIAGTYVQISNEHLMDRISCLGRLVALDPIKDEHEMRKEREKLHNGCQEAQQAILSIVMKKKAEFNAKVEERIAKLHEIEKDMPPIEPERIKEIQTNVTSGMAKWTKEEIADIS